MCLSVCVRVCNEGQRAFGSVCVRVLYILHYSGAHLPLLFLPCLVSTLQGGLFCRLDVFSAGAALIFELREKSSFTLLSRKTHAPHILNRIIIQLYAFAVGISCMVWMCRIVNLKSGFCRLVELFWAMPSSCVTVGWCSHHLMRVKEWGESRKGRQKKKKKNIRQLVCKCMQATPSEIQSGCHLGRGCYYEVPVKCGLWVAMQNKPCPQTSRHSGTGTGSAGWHQ